MTWMHMLLRGLRQHGWLNLAVALAVAVATTALTGALIVGDSVRDSLRQLVIERLEPIDLLLFSPRFLDPDRVAALHEAALKETGQQEASLQKAGQPEPARPADWANVHMQAVCLLPQATVEKQNGGMRCRGVFLSAWSDSPWEIGRDEIVINAALAEELNVEVGDSLVLRVPNRSSAVPTDSPLANKEDLVRSRAGLQIQQILPMTGWGKFSLARNQARVVNAFVALPTLQRTMGVGNRVNAIVARCRHRDGIGYVADDRDRDVRAETLKKVLNASLQGDAVMRLGDYGVKLKQVKATYDGDRVAWTTWHFTSDRLLFDPVIESALLAAGVGVKQRPEPSLTYLANSISLVTSANGKSGESDEIPYSMVAATTDDWLQRVEMLEGTATDLGRDGIVLNRWAAEALNVKLGAPIRLTYFAPEASYGDVVERKREFRLQGICGLESPVTAYRRNAPALFNQRPTRANDPDLTPEVQGVTDQATMDSWEPPFPFDATRVKRRDDEYWDSYRTTPKAFVSFNAGQAMWGSRFGDVTGIRVDSQTITRTQLEQAAVRQLNRRNADLGYAFQAIRNQQLAAAAGTTPFEALFLGFNFFLIAAALMLIGILFRLAIQLRAYEIGLLQATGWSPWQVRRLVLGEAAVVALVGALVGVFGGVVAAGGLLRALRTWWVRAITSPFVHLAVTPRAVAMGLAISFSLAMLVALWTIYSLKAIEVTPLLRGQVESPPRRRSVRRWPVRWGWFCGALAAVAAMYGSCVDGIAKAGAFFGGGTFFLISALIYVRFQLLQGKRDVACGMRTMGGLAMQSAKRSPTRSTLMVGLIASAVFLVYAIAAFRLTPTDSGSGGFELVCVSDRPLFANLADKKVALREMPEWQPEDSIVMVRVKAGDDASCRNLYRVSRPQMLGVSSQFVERFDSQQHRFSWARVGRMPDGSSPENPWRLLQIPAKAVLPTRREKSSVGTEAGGIAPPAIDTDDPWRETAPGDLAETGSLPNEPRPAIPVILDLNTALYSLHLKGRIGEKFTIEYESPVQFQIVALLANSVFQGSLITTDQQLQSLFPNVSGARMLCVDTAGDPDKAKALLEDRYSDEGLDGRAAGAILDDLLAVQNTYLSTFQSLGALGLLLGTLGVSFVQLRSVVERRGEFALLQTLGFANRRVRRLVLYESVYLLGVGLGIGVLAAIVAIVPHLADGAASLPWGTGVGLLGAIGVCALLASNLAIRAARRVPVLETVRREAH